MHCPGDGVAWLLVVLCFCSSKIDLVIKKMTISQVDVCRRNERLEAQIVATWPEDQRTDLPKQTNCKVGYISVNLA